MSQGPRTWVLGRLDAFLPEVRRTGAPEELSRCRVLVGTILLLFAFCVAFVLIAPFFPSATVQCLVGSVGGVGLALLLGALRRGGSPRLVSLGVCGLLVLCFLVSTVAFSHQSVSVAAHATAMLLPLLTVYLLGVRMGLAVTLLFCLNAALVVPLLGAEPGIASLSTPAAWLRGMMDGFVLLLGWGLCALFGMAREEAAATAFGNERKLLSLLESTDDPVCSVNPQGEVITANGPARRLFREVFGLEMLEGAPLDHSSSAARQAEWRERMDRVLQGQHLRFEWPCEVAGRPRVLDMSVFPLWGAERTPMGVTLFGRDITERKESEAKLAELHRSLMDVSRQAGMAEVATDVLHNVGNTLNSVNVSAGLVVEWLRGSRAPALSRAAQLLREHEADLPTFLREDPRGRPLVDYLSSATQHMAREHEGLMEEMQGLIRNVEHIRAVVSMQQTHARVGGWQEPVHVAELLDDALRLHANSFERQGIRILRDYAELSPVVLDRHRLLQIVVNLLNNARHAMMESGRPDKQLSLRVSREGEEWLRIEVKDNGVGIDPEHLPRLFTHGFTTKKDGHGFGLHASALAAEAMNGHLRCDSGGRGQGARFLIELPLRGQENPA